MGASKSISVPSTRVAIRLARSGESVLRFCGDFSISRARKERNDAIAGVLPRLIDATERYTLFIHAEGDLVALSEGKRLPDGLRDSRLSLSR